MPMSGSQQHAPEALEGQGEGKGTVVLLWFILSAGLFQVVRHLLIHELDIPASELRDHTDAVAAAVPAGSRRWPCQTHIDDRTPPHCFPQIHQRSLFVMSLHSCPGQEGFFQGCTDALLQRRHVGVLFVCLGLRCPVAAMPAGML